MLWSSAPAARRLFARIDFPLVFHRLGQTDTMCAFRIRRSHDLFLRNFSVATPYAKGRYGISDFSLFSVIALHQFIAFHMWPECKGQANNSSARIRSWKLTSFFCRSFPFHRSSAQSLRLTWSFYSANWFNFRRKYRKKWNTRRNSKKNVSTCCRMENGQAHSVRQVISISSR